MKVELTTFDMNTYWFATAQTWDKEIDQEVMSARHASRRVAAQVTLNLARKLWGNDVEVVILDREEEPEKIATNLKEMGVA